MLIKEKRDGERWRKILTFPGCACTTQWTGKTERTNERPVDLIGIKTTTNGMIHVCCVLSVKWFICRRNTIQVATVNPERVFSKQRANGIDVASD